MEYLTGVLFLFVMILWLPSLLLAIIRKPVDVKFCNMAIYCGAVNTMTDNCSVAVRQKNNHSWSVTTTTDRIGILIKCVETEPK